MTVWVGLVRAVNVGGTGKLPMSELVELCVGLGFGEVRTYIQSGNVVFSSNSSEDAVRGALEAALAPHRGKPVDVVMRSADQLVRVLKLNPFRGEEPAKVAVALSATPLSPTLLDDFTHSGPERLALAPREIYLHYPEGMGRSKLKLPRTGTPVTARNINTLTKLVAMARA